MVITLPRDLDALADLAPSSDTLLLGLFDLSCSSRTGPWWSTWPHVKQMWPDAAKPSAASSKNIGYASRNVTTPDHAHRPRATPRRPFDGCERPGQEP
jgi:hypothetical protein